MERATFSRVIIRKAAASDIPGIAALEAATSASPWSERSLRCDVEENENAYVAVLVARESTALQPGTRDGIPECVIGYADMWTVAGEAQLNNIAVDGSYRGRGLGEKLLSHMIEKSRELEQTVMTLEVRRGNAAALGLYSKLGFTIAGVRPGYYEDNGEDAVLMDLELQQLTAGQ